MMPFMPGMPGYPPMVYPHMAGGPQPPPEKARSKAQPCLGALRTCDVSCKEGPEQGREEAAGQGEEPLG